jgi:CRISPR/Cas system-associated protein Cas7 (RAMP superfamily)
MKKVTEELMLQLTNELQTLLYTRRIKSELVSITPHMMDMIIIKLETKMIFFYQLKYIHNFVREYCKKHDILIDFSIELRNNSLCLVIF